MRTKRTPQAPAEFPGEVSQAFNLAAETTQDGWTRAQQLAQSARDRAEASRRQLDMFPDCDLNPAR